MDLGASLGETMDGCVRWRRSFLAACRDAAIADLGSFGSPPPPRVNVCLLPPRLQRPFYQRKKKRQEKAQNSMGPSGRRDQVAGSGPAYNRRCRRAGINLQTPSNSKKYIGDLVLRASPAVRGLRAEIRRYIRPNWM
jgi:hypothetical protein